MLLLYITQRSLITVKLYDVLTNVRTFGLEAQNQKMLIIQILQNVKWNFDTYVKSKSNEHFI